MVLRIGVIGLGYWGPNLARNVAACRDTELAALCDLDGERLERVASQYPTAARFDSVDALLDGDHVDAVIVATPVRFHYELARAALESGKHVLVEKPFTATVAEGIALRELAASRQRVVMVDHVFLYSPPVRKVLDLHQAGEFGRLLFLDAVRINLGLFQSDVNVLWDLAPHDLSIFDALLGREPSGLIATGKAHAIDHMANVAHLSIDYGSDLLASLHVNWLSPVKIRHFLVGGSRRSALYNDLDQSEPIKVYDRGIDLADDPEGQREARISYRTGDVVSPNIDKSEPLQNMIGHFARCVATGERPLSDADQGIRVVKVLEAADASLAKGGSYVELARG